MTASGNIVDFTTIIKSVLDTSCEEIFHVVKNLQDTVNILAPVEVKVLGHLVDEYGIAGSFPPEPVFLKFFPEYSVSLASLAPLDKESLRYYVTKFLYVRRNLHISRHMLGVADQVSRDGLSSQMVEEIRSFLPVMESVEDDLTPWERYRKTKDESHGILSYVPEVDALIGSITPSTVAIIAGYVASFKSTWALNMAYKNARDGRRIVFISLEMRKADLEYNLWCLHSQHSKFASHQPIPHDSIRKFKLLPAEEEYLFNTVVEDYNNTIAKNLVILDETNVDDFSEGTIRTLLYQIDDESPIDSVFVDHMNLTKFYAKERNLQTGEAINKYVSFFRRLCLSFRVVDGQPRNISAVLLAQCNRTGWSRASKGGGRYDLTALSEANELERASSVVLMVYTNEDMKLSKRASVQCLKSRFGGTLTDPIEVLCLPELASFGEGNADITREVDASVFDSILGISSKDLGFSSSSPSGISLSDFDF